jgi:PAS domain S-box-containing protein
VYSSPISLKEGPALFSIIHDVTERKQAEESLRVSEEKFSKAFNTSPEAITIASMEDGRFIDVNEVFLAVTGYARETVVGRTSSELNLWIKADDRQRYIETLVAEGFLRNLEVDLRMQNGTIRSFLVSSETVELAGRPCSLNFMTDVTERRQAEEHLHLLEAQLLQEQKLATVGTLADGVAHEINNPLTGVINFAQLIVDRITSAGQAPETAEELRGFAGEIINEGERMASIVRKLLAFSRQEQVRYLPVPPGEVIDAILSLMHKLLEKNEISVVVGLPDNLPLVLCSSPQIQQVLLNLLTNARDALLERWKGYHAEKTVTIDAAILADSEGHWVRISVADRGNGIPPEIAARIFDPFFTTKPRERGTGLGLSISYGIVKEHGGRLSFETRPGKGTVFHLDLPEAGASDTPASMRGAPGA